MSSYIKTAGDGRVLAVYLAEQFPDLPVAYDEDGSVTTTERHPAIPADAVEIDAASAETLADDGATRWTDTGPWRWTGSALEPYVAPFDLDQAKRGRAADVNARRDIAIGGGYQHNFGGTAGIRTLDQRSESDAINWLGLKSLADSLIAAGSGAQAMQIRDAADETFSASANVVSSAMVAMAEWRSAIMSHSWTLKDQISAAVDEAAIAAIDVETGWPS